MAVETDRRERYLHWLFAWLALVVPALVGYGLYFQLRTPVLDFYQAGDDASTVYQVVPGGEAEAAGLQAGDVILAADGVPFTGWRDLRLGQTCILEVERDGQRLTLAIPVVSVAQANSLPLLGAFVVVVLTFWATGAVLLLRRFQRKEVRLLFLVTQTTAVALLWPLARPRPWPIPDWMAFLSIACFNLTPALVLHFYLTFPESLGTPRQRAWGLGAIYGLAPAAIAGGLSNTELGIRLSIFYTALVFILAISVLIYAYLRRATPDGRRRLRLIVLGNLLALLPPILLYFLPAVAGARYRMPNWPAVRLFVVIAPLSHLYATARHNLFGIDRLLNRTLVYAILSLGILLLYLGPFLLIYRSLPGDWPAQVVVVAALTLLVGASFDPVRRRVQHGVDRLFYGGWYDYPGVVETASAALARCAEREQLAHVLTCQAPALMQLREGRLWIGEEKAVLPEQAVPPQMGFTLAFRGQARGLWIVEPRRDGDDFSEADRRILQTLARQAETALGNVLLVETLRRQLSELHASRETLAHAQRQLLRSREEERARLARDLHDGPIQALVGLNLQLGLLLAPAGASPIGEPLSAMRGEVRDLLADLRRVCAALRPPMLDTLGLGAALRALAEEWSAQWGVTVQLDLPSDATLRALPGEVAVNLYRVAQEALSNVARHAAARLVSVRLAWQDSRLVLTLHDDGRGFVVPAHFHDLMAQEHFGLVGMGERVNLIGGDWTVESAPGQGTTVRVAWQPPG